MLPRAPDRQRKKERKKERKNERKKEKKKFDIAICVTCE
jgi:hypothetical protein